MVSTTTRSTVSETRGTKIGRDVHLRPSDGRTRKSSRAAGLALGNVHHFFAELDYRTRFHMSYGPIPFGCSTVQLLSEGMETYESTRPSRAEGPLSSSRSAIAEVIQAVSGGHTYAGNASIHVTPPESGHPCVAPVHALRKLVNHLIIVKRKKGK